MKTNKLFKKIACIIGAMAIVQPSKTLLAKEDVAYEASFSKCMASLGETDRRQIDNSSATTKKSEEHNGHSSESPTVTPATNNNTVTNTNNNTINPSAPNNPNAAID